MHDDDVVKKEEVQHYYGEEFKNNNEEDNEKKIDDEEAYINYDHYTHLSSQNNKGYASFTIIVHQRKSEIKSRSIMNSIRTYNT